MDDFTRNAIESAIRTEKESHIFYLLAASRVNDIESKRLLRNLAGEEFEHLSGFLKIYPGDEEQASSILASLTSGTDNAKWELLAMDRDVDNREKVFRIAIIEEQSCIDQYSTFVGSIRLPEVQKVFAKTLEQTRDHLATIEAEYARCMAMVNDPERNTYLRE